jgi:hypothetical protein
MLWKTLTDAGDVVDAPGFEPVSAPPPPPELPPFDEQERQPPRKGSSNLTYRRLVLPDGVQVSVVAKVGWAIDEVVRFIPNDGTDPVIKIITRRVRGRPTAQQTNGSGADHATE